MNNKNKIQRYSNIWGENLEVNDHEQDYLKVLLQNVSVSSEDFLLL